MALICPTVTAENFSDYDRQIKLVAQFGHRIQIDLADGNFAKGINIEPKDAWWPAGIKADFHLMYRNPQEAIKIVLEHIPNLVIVHAEADGDFMSFVSYCDKAGVKVGIALLEPTNPEIILEALPHIHHVCQFRFTGEG